MEICFVDWYVCKLIFYVLYAIFFALKSKHSFFLYYVFFLWYEGTLKMRSHPTMRTNNDTFFCIAILSWMEMHCCNSHYHVLNIILNYIIARWIIYFHFDLFCFVPCSSSFLCWNPKQRNFDFFFSFIQRRALAFKLGIYTDQSQPVILKSNCTFIFFIIVAIDVEKRWRYLYRQQIGEIDDHLVIKLGTFLG